MCHNKFLSKYVLVAVAVVLGAVVLMRPSLTGPVLLLAVVAACPLSMMFMMKMNKQHASSADTAAGTESAEDATWPADTRAADRPSGATPHAGGYDDIS